MLFGECRHGVGLTHLLKQLMVFELKWVLLFFCHSAFFRVFVLFFRE